MHTSQTETIPAAHDLRIELGPRSWRLLNGTNDVQPDALVVADEGGLTCATAFAQSRHFPTDRLVPADVARVVVGWAPESHNWHLGLLLAGDAPRWCSLANWPSGHATEHMTQARLAGQSLARILDRPFHLVPATNQPVVPAQDTQPLQPTERMAAQDLARDINVKLPPFEFDDWVMIHVPGKLIWRHRDRWVWANLVRGVVLLGVVVVFILLGVGAQTSGLAAVNPSWLPLVGIIVAIVLAFNALYSLWAVATMTDVVFDVGKREVRCQRRWVGGPKWQLSFDDVEYVLVSQTPARSQGRSRPDLPMRTGQEVWLHLYDGQRFWEVVALERVEGQSQDWDRVRHSQREKGRRRLRLRDYDTSAHHAARVMADTLTTHVWLDIR